MQINTQGVKDPHEIGGGTGPTPGKYHVLVKAVDETFSNPKLPNLIPIEFEILHGTIPGQKGRTHRELFSVEPKNVDRLKRLAMILGLIGPGEQKNVVFAEGIGRQCIIEIEANTYEGKTRNQIPYFRAGIWAIGNPDIKDVPLDQTMLQLHGQGARIAPPGGQPAAPASGPASAPAQPQAVGAGAAAAVDPWANV